MEIHKLTQQLGSLSELHICFKYHHVAGLLVVLTLCRYDWRCFLLQVNEKIKMQLVTVGKDKFF